GIAAHEAEEPTEGRLEERLLGQELHIAHGDEAAAADAEEEVEIAGVRRYHHDVTLQIHGQLALDAPAGQGVEEKMINAPHTAPVLLCCRSAPLSRNKSFAPYEQGPSIGDRSTSSVAFLGRSALPGRRSGVLAQKR